VEGTERNDGIIVEPVRTLRSQRLILGAVCFSLLAPLLALLSACSPTGLTVEEGAPRDGADSMGDRGPVVTVSRVVDGDTVEVALAVDRLTEVRLIGVDTPETKDPPHRRPALRRGGPRGPRP
jgi:endonuclease YncB( thermonuclease family)